MGGFRTGHGEGLSDASSVCLVCVAGVLVSIVLCFCVRVRAFACCCVLTRVRACLVPSNADISTTTRSRLCLLACSITSPTLYGCE